MNAPPILISLDGTWQLRWYDSQRGDSAERVAKGLANMERAWPAQVPGCVHSTLIDLGLIPEPTIGLNVLAGRWVEETIWHYRKTFQCPRIRSGQRAWLVCEELDLAATVFLNQKDVGTHCNLYYPCVLDVTDAIQEGENSIVIRIESGLFHAADLPAGGLEKLPAMFLTKKPWLRKPAFSHGWDWSPRLLNVGITGSVRIEIMEALRCEAWSIQTLLSANGREGKVVARAFLKNVGTEPVPVTLHLRLPDLSVAQECKFTIPPGTSFSEISATLTEPPLWWPHGHGPQPLFTVEAEAVQGDHQISATIRRVGFRSIEVQQHPHPCGGRYFVLHVNGKPIFCKGANLVPPDILPSRVTNSHYAQLVDLALEANFNFLRVWGGGLYERDAFYDLCDEKGILVWQDFAFACNRYPGHDHAFRSEISREATHQVRRLAHHPSLAVWCGNNECELGAYEWWTASGYQMPDHGIFHDLLPRIIREEDPSRFYWPGSPYSPDYEPPNADYCGDQHPWSVGFFDTDFRKYRSMICRFPNEGGILGPVSLPTVRSCLPPGHEHFGSFAFEIHDNSIAYWGDSVPLPDQMILDWLGLDPRSLSIEDYVYWAGLLQGQGLETYIKNFRSRMFDSAAAVFWMFNDAWPCTRSWSIVDYALRRTPAFGPVRRSMQPLGIILTIDGKDVAVRIVNDGAQQTVCLEWGIVALAGGYPRSANAKAVAPANAAKEIARFPLADLESLGVTRHAAYAVMLDEKQNHIGQDLLILPRYREMDWPPAALSVSLGPGSIILSSDTLAWRVCLDLEGGEPRDDNFFDILPGKPREIAWQGAFPAIRCGNLAVSNWPPSQTTPSS